jgi:hypothetical protein
MDYGRIIKDAWNLTWRFRFLWLLGFFVGGGGASGFGANSGYRYQSGGTPQMPPGTNRAFESFVAWVQANAGLLIALAIVLLLIMLIFAVVSFIAQGGLTRASADLYRGIPVSSAEAWRYGLRFAWRYVGLFFLQVLIGIVIAVSIGIMIAILAAVAYVFGDAGRIIALIVGVVLTIVGTISLIVFGVGFGLTVTYAKRAIAILDLGVFDSLRRGFDVLRANVGSSLLLWLISIGLGIAAAIIVSLVLIVVLVPLALLGVVFYAIGSGLSTGFAIYMVIAVLVFIAAACAVGAIVNTFFWHYWTIAFLRLIAPPAAPVPPLEPSVPAEPAEPAAYEGPLGPTDSPLPGEPRE